MRKARLVCAYEARIVSGEALAYNGCGKRVLLVRRRGANKWWPREEAGKAC